MSNRALICTALMAVTLCALPALAGPDNVGLGTGRDNALSVPAGTSVMINSYAQVTAPLAPGDNAIVVGNATGFATGDLVLVMQMTGIVPEPPSGGPSPVDITNDPVGRWEFARLGPVAGNVLNLTAPLINPYASNVTQVIRVREYTSVTINALANITAPAWDGSTGGVVAFLATGTLALNSSPGINVTAKGFRGGTAVEDSSGSTGCTGLDEPALAGAQKGEGIAFMRFGPTQTGRGRVANGGGGGVCLKSGGGGGSNGGTGGQGGNSEQDLDGNRIVGGQGGAALSYGLLNHLVMGGGGGAGHVQTPSATTVRGGVGGGIIFVRAGAISGPGTMVANGGTGGSTTGENAASGGGGGGSIYVRIAGAAACGNLQAIGGTGGNANEGSALGPGGGGGGGRVLLQKASGTCAPTATAVNGASAGGQQESTAPGGSAYNAQPGTAGSTTIIPATGFPVLPAPQVNTPANGSRSNNAAPTYSGTISVTPALPAGTEIAIFVDGAEVGRTTANALGNWSFTPGVPLGTGTHTVNAVAINTAQAVQSVNSNTNTFVVDLTPPTVSVTAPAEGSRTNNTTPTYSGTVSDNGPGPVTVVVRVDGTVLGNATVVGNTWTFTPIVPLAQGTHTVLATATDDVGNTASDSNDFTVDLTAPAVAVTAPAEGSRTNDTTPTYSGTVSDNGPGPFTVVVRVDGTVVGNATVVGNTWTLTPTVPLGEGIHTITATATDDVGNTASDSNDFTVDITAPTVAVATPAEGSRTNNTTPTYSGTVEAGATVSITVDGVVLGNATVTGTTWTFTPTAPLAEGPHTVMATATDEAGNTANDSNNFTVDLTAPTVAVTTPAEGSRTNDTTPTYSGTVEAGATVSITVDGVVLGNATVTGTTWTFTPTLPLLEGPHTVTATATDEAGNTASDSNDFAVDLTAPTVAVATPAEGSHTNDSTPTYSGTVEAGATVVITVDGTMLGNATVMGTTWTFTPTVPLAEGPHTVTATAWDDVGNTADDSNIFTVDSMPPAAPVVRTPAHGSTLSDTTPNYRGTAEPGSSVTLIVDGVAMGSTTAGATGYWSLTPPMPLAAGPHTVKAFAANLGGTSPDSSTCTFTVIRDPRTGGWNSTGDLVTARIGHTATVLRSGKVLVIGGQGPGGSLDRVEVFDPGTGGWSTTGALITARRNHSATLLHSGKVLVIGGEGSSGPLDSAELYDPDSGEWSSAGELVTARTGHTATVLLSGQVLVTGGEGSSGFLNSAELYIPDTGEWRTTNPLATARQNHTATVLRSGEVLVAGGESSGGPLDSVELYDPDTGTWRTTNPLAAARQNHSATELLSGQVLVTGGEGSSGLLTRTELYNPATESWSTTGALATARRNPSAVLLPSGRVLVAGGEGPGGALASTEVYAPSTEVWSPTGLLATARQDHTATVLHSGHVLITGGRDTGGLLASVEIYEAVGASRPAAPLPESRKDFMTVLLPNGLVLMVGGSDASGALASARLYNPVTELWTEAASMGTPRSGATATLLPTGQVLVTGGRAVSRRGLQAQSAGDGEVLATAEVFDPKSNTWSSTGSLREARYSHSALLLSTGQVLVTGGRGANDTLCSTAEVYDVATGTWLQTGSMNEPRQQHMVAQLPTGQVLVAGGRNARGAPLASAEVYDPREQKWTVTQPMSTARVASTAVPLPTSQVMVVGGTDDHGILSSVEIYVPGRGEWTPAKPLKTPRESHTALLLPTGRVLIMGGANASTVLDSVEVYDTALNQWEDMARLIDPREDSVTVRLATGKVLLLGGEDLIGPLENTELYDEFGPPDPLRPVVDPLSPQRAGAHLSVTGRGFKAPPGGSSRVRLQLAPRGALRDVPEEERSDTSVQVSLAGVPDGFHLLFVMVNDIAGGRVVQVDGTPPQVPEVSAFTHTPRTLSGTAEPYSTVQVFVDDHEQGTAEANVRGAWSLQLTNVLGDGTYRASATAMDFVGNTSPRSMPYVFTVDTQAPEAPVVDPLKEPTKDSKPTLSGTAEPRSTVTVFMDDQEIGTAVADTEGFWSLTVRRALKDGVHTASATARDAAGNTSPASAALTFFVDTQAPTAPEVRTPEEGAVMDLPTVTTSGRAEPDSLVAVFLDGQVRGTAKADTVGSWSLTLDAGPEKGERTLSATAQDAAGNISPSSTGRTFTVGRHITVVPGGCSGCAASPGESSLVLLGLAVLQRLLARRRHQGSSQVEHRSHRQGGGR